MEDKRMNPITITEKMMFCTTKITASDGSSGTGFFFQFNINGISIPVIITNKHVVRYNNNETVQFCFHTQENDKVLNQSITITITIDWYFHSTQDICFCYLQPIIDFIQKQTGKQVYYLSTDESIIYSDSQLEELSAIEDVVMVGYPIGLWDESNNLPIFRKGTTASHPYFNFNNNSIGVVDMACFPGSSGSPIYILNENSYSDKKGNTYMCRSRLILLGILYAGPIYNAQGELRIQEIPTSQRVSSTTPIMTNLGYYAKAKELLEFRDIIKQKLTSIPPTN